MAQTSAQNLVIDSDVVAVLGHYRPETSAPAAGVYAEAGLPFLLLGEGETAESPVWNLAPSPSALAAAMASVVDVAMGETVALWMQPGWAEKVGQLLATDALLDQTPTITHARVLRHREPVFNLLSPIEAAESFNQAGAAGWQGQGVGALNLASSAFSHLVAADKAVHFVTPYPFPQDVADASPWIAAYQKVGPHVPVPGPYALPTYEAVYVIASAVAAAQDAAHLAPRTLDRAAVRAALDAVHREGFLGVITWDAGGYWAGAPLYHYRWTASGPELLNVWR
jgi:ABC-type branched-subunit amino acid transport system substrate-binding protein